MNKISNVSKMNYHMLNGAVVEMTRSVIVNTFVGWNETERPLFCTSMLIINLAYDVRQMRIMLFVKNTIVRINIWNCVYIHHAQNGPTSSSIYAPG